MNLTGICLSLDRQTWFEFQCILKCDLAETLILKRKIVSSARIEYPYGLLSRAKVYFYTGSLSSLRASSQVLSVTAYAGSNGRVRCNTVYLEVECLDLLPKPPKEEGLWHTNYYVWIL